MKKVNLILTYQFSFILLGVLFSFFSLDVNGQSSFYDENCADQVFNKYMKESEPVFDRYMDSAGNIPLPESEFGINNYLDNINNLAEDYLEQLNPHAQRYAEELSSCLY